MKRHLFLLVLSLSLGACLPPNNSQLSQRTRSATTPVTAVKRDTKVHKVDLSWSCTGKGKADAAMPGVALQEEYCEWDRKSVAAGKERELVCRFTSSFDRSRKMHLTSRRLDKNFLDTRFNSLSFLLSGKLPEDPEKRRGIIFHCMKRKCEEPDIEKPTYLGNCVPVTRASDPSICLALNDLAARDCTVEVEKQEKFTAVESVSPVPGDTEEKVQIQIPPNLRDACHYVRDEKFSVSDSGPVPSKERTLVKCDFSKTSHMYRSCDEVARSLSVVVSLKVSQCIL